jgi:site-specific DNA recombinase
MRNSTDEQAEAGTIEAQRYRIVSWLTERGIEPVAWYEDPAVSGAVAHDKRPGTGQLMEDAKRGRFDTVIFYDLSRMGRTLKVIVDFYDALQRSMVDVFLVYSPLGEHVDTSTTMGKFGFHLLAAVAELERGMIMERSRSGRNARASNGFWPSANVKYGLIRDLDGRLVPFTQALINSGMYTTATDLTGNPMPLVSEAETVTEIFRRRASGQTLNQIRDDLNAQGIPSTRKQQEQDSRRG